MVKLAENILYLFKDIISIVVIGGRVFAMLGALGLMLVFSIGAISEGISSHKWGYVIAGAIFGYIFFLSDWGWWRRGR
jgi:hypothetical protein